jgi:hypothetical protein
MHIKFHKDSFRHSRVNRERILRHADIMIIT